ncbi:MAG: alanine racemase [Clostridiales bacterium]|nr:alanine racemase [Clostridiales bacterium]
MVYNANGQRLLAEIDLDSIVFNYRQACRCAPGSLVCCVVKANAYGHGAVPVARALAAAGAKYFAVATPEEALQLRRHDLKQKILVMGPVGDGLAELLAQQDIAVTVASREAAKEYAAAALGQRIKIHIKLETGLARLGFPYESAIEEILSLAACPAFKIEGLFSHFSATDMEEENDFTYTQMARLLAVKEGLSRRGLHIPLLHCAGSAAIIAHPDTHGTMVRPGIMLFGCNPMGPHPLPLKPTLSLRARVAQVFKVKQGESVGYGRAWYAPRDTLIATISAGYGDGLQRILSGRLPVLIRGQEAKQVGRICMDMCMVDVTDIPGVLAGDTATIIGGDGERVITVEQVAEAAKTIPHEIFCNLSLRVPRLYYQNGQLAEEVNYLNLL